MIRVLYAEDSPQIAEMVRLFFDRLAPDCALTIVPDGRRCLEQMAVERPDVVLLDMLMPGLNGLQVLGELAARRDPTPAIMVTSQGDDALAVKALRAGAVDCIDKNSPEFLCLHEIVRRVHASHCGRAAPAAAPVAAARVLHLDVSAHGRAELAAYFAAHAPGLELVSAAPGELERRLDEEPGFAALVIGPEPGPAGPLEWLRRFRSRAGDAPTVVLSTGADSETAIAAFKLGAHDFLVQRPGWLPELVFTLHHALKQADAARDNLRLTRQLDALNRSLGEQVATRTRELAALSRRLLRVQEEERRAVARELHDQVGQMLTGLQFVVEAARSAARPDLKLAEAGILTREILHCVRELTLQLRPRILDDFGLRPALEWHAARFQRQTGLAVQFECSLPATRLPGEVETAIFRTVQEALTNVARHAGAAIVAVAVTAGDRTLHLEVSDRGRGFDVARMAGASAGLAGMAERIALAGGTLEIFSQPGLGTRLHAEFPLAPAAAAPAP